VSVIQKSPAAYRLNLKKVPMGKSRPVFDLRKNSPHAGEAFEKWVFTTFNPTRGDKPAAYMERMKNEGVDSKSWLLN
jgi:hypothetical protein